MIKITALVSVAYLLVINFLLNLIASGEHSPTSFFLAAFHIFWHSGRFLTIQSGFAADPICPIN